MDRLQLELQFDRLNHNSIGKLRKCRFESCPVHLGGGSNGVYVEEAAVTAENYV